MTLQNRDIYRAHGQARRGKFGSDAWLAATLADVAFDEMSARARKAGFKVPGDDRAENFIVEAFKLSCYAVGVDLNDLVATVTRLDRYTEDKL